MTKCGKSCMPECEYFTTGGCISPFNCPYRIEELSPNSATSVSSIYIQNLISENAVLKTENAALRKRLENAVELPCKVGYTIYRIHGMSNPIIKDWKVQEIIITDHNFVVICGHPETEDRGVEVSDHYKEWWFTDRAEAEARLVELK